MAKTFNKGGIHPPQNKFTSGSPIVDVELPRRVTLFLSQHIGVPAVAVVKPGDHVKRGDLIGAAEAYMSVPVYTPISGTVKTIAPASDGTGVSSPAVTIVADDADHQADLDEAAPVRLPQEKIDSYTPQNIKDAARLSGVVGLGGATFPMHVKLSPPEGMVIDTIVVNGAECEPFLTCDEALMCESPADIVGGTLLVAKAVGAKRVLIGIEDNKPLAIQLMTEAAAAHEGVDVVPLKTKYPQGGEKQLIYALTGKEVPTGALPAAIGCVVINVTSAYTLFRAMAYRQPFYERIITISGLGFEGIGNYRVALGSSLAELLDKLVPDWKSASKIIAGGPMMGKALESVDVPVRKGTSGLVLLPEKMARRSEVEPCVRCARCIDACPMGLEPFLISTHSRLGRYEEALETNIMSCIECGSCQYVCPSSRPLLDFIRTGKKGARLLMKK